MTNQPTEADWLAFKAVVEDACQPVCPFCGIRHQPINTHPYCTMVRQCKGWLAAGRPSKG